MDILSDLNSALPGADKSDIMNHKFYHSHADRFSSRQTCKLGP